MELKRNIVKQDYKLINAKYKLTTSEIKFILTVIAQINAKDNNFTEYEIKVKDLEEKLQATKHKTRLKQFAKNIMSKPLLIENDGNFEVFNWFSKIKYISNEAKFLVNIHEDLKPFLLNLKERFVQYNLAYILKLKSNYSIKIYQLLKEYENFQRRKFSVDELRNCLEVPESYKKKYNDFKKKVLLVAEAEINKHTDIFIEFEEIKKRRKVISIDFKIRKNFDNIFKDFTTNKQRFINYIRLKYAPSIKEKIYPTIISTTEGNLKIDKYGKLYLVKNNNEIRDYNFSEAQKLWTWLYDLAKKNTYQF